MKWRWSSRHCAVGGVGHQPSSAYWWQGCQYSLIFFLRYEAGQYTFWGACKWCHGAVSGSHWCYFPWPMLLQPGFLLLSFFFNSFGEFTLGQGSWVVFSMWVAMGHSDMTEKSQLLAVRFKPVFSRFRCPNGVHSATSSAIDHPSSRLNTVFV